MNPPKDRENTIAQYHVTRDFLEGEYGIPMTKELKDEVKEMCNLGETLAEESRDAGIIAGREGTALNMLRRLVKRQQPIDSQAVSDIAEDTELTVSRVQELARDNGFVLQ